MQKNQQTYAAMATLLIDSGDGFSGGLSAFATMPEDGGGFALYFDVSFFQEKKALRFLPAPERYESVFVSNAFSDRGTLTVTHAENGSFLLTGVYDTDRWVCVRGECVGLPEVVLMDEGGAISIINRRKRKDLEYDWLNQSRLEHLPLIGWAVRGAFRFSEKRPKVWETLLKFKRKLRKIIYSVRSGRKQTLEGYYKKKLDFDRFLTDEERQKQQTHAFQNPPRISVIVPLYNTKDTFFDDLVRSLQSQTYTNWELCLSDASDDVQSVTSQRAMSLPQEDARILYRKLEKNQGISLNTNEGLAIATGDYITLLDHDDFLHPSALYKVARAIEEEGADFVYTDEAVIQDKRYVILHTHYKPDFSPDTLRGHNYICHMTVFKRTLLDEVGGTLRSDLDGSQDFDLFLRLTEKAKKIHHIPQLLYFWRSHKNSTADSIEAKPYAIQSGIKALQSHLDRIGLKGIAKEGGKVPTAYRAVYEIKGEPKVSIIIPNKDKHVLLSRCVQSIFEKSSYTNIEIVIVENGSTETKTFELYNELKKNEKIRLVVWKDDFNYSSINNFGAAESTGEYLLFLNNDIEVIEPKWIEELLMFGQRSDVGAVGSLLLYPDDTVQHAGIILGIGGCAGHPNRNHQRSSPGRFSRLSVAQNLMAVTGACMMVSRKNYFCVGGLDPSFAVAFNDVDFCVRLYMAGHLNIFTPFSVLYHYESVSRGIENTPEKRKRFQLEVARFQKRWEDLLMAGDTYYNPNLTLKDESLSPKKQPKKKNRKKPA